MRMDPVGQGEVDVRVKHQWTVSVGGVAGRSVSACASFAAHWPATHWQALISRKPHTLIMPPAWHCASTPLGSVALLTLTQAGNAPQQLPTFFTVQSASVRQVVVVTMTALPAAGPLVEPVAGGGAAVSAGGAATQPVDPRQASSTSMFRHRDKRRDMRPLRSG
ncbi:conserved hypothetical protein [Xanthomonas citri pv. citri]|nr:conserved hypothetical protein [Xanthomonas citri pv. citri]CEE19494.1 conserved hypothetical protein [Xanthomonas citri pv. citri]CEE80795.1 conserved hypothetical protein [Xanthomonas citri pv. citri]CEE82586.1 conserved hypothetical protein [Xanthomonas citri pv. citri]CEF23326.1 conserved hypothetical protein [Xanthomonas citri pv. citri]